MDIFIFCINMVVLPVFVMGGPVNQLKLLFALVVQTACVALNVKSSFYFIIACKTVTWLYLLYVADPSDWQTFMLVTSDIIVHGFAIL